MEERRPNNAEMTPQPLDRLFDLFIACREMDGQARSVWLRDACEGNVTLQRAVENLIREDASAAGFLSEPAGWAAAGALPFTITEGLRLGRYMVAGFIGRGGMGEVWQAHDEELDRSVALKFMASSFAVNQLTQEARMASALNHPGIVTVHDVAAWQGSPILVMELVTGVPLSRFRGGDLDTERLMDLAAQIAAALAAAHSRGIVHGDLKPENIMVRDDWYIKVLDFGLARRAAIESNAGTDAAVFGTLRYMSPEQARGELLMPASDIFSLGLVLFELATGRHAFPDSSPLNAVRAALTQTAPAPASLKPQIPPVLNALIVAMLSKDPTLRPSAIEIADRLRAASRKRTDLRRHWMAALLLVAAGLSAAAWYLLVRRDLPQFANLRIQPLTSQAGWEASPAFSPDGRSIAFTWAERADAPPQIYVKQVDEGTPVKITGGDTPGSIGPLVWSPDGKSIAFKSEQNGAGAVYLIPSSGGKASKALDMTNPYLSARIDWSPDGNELAFSDVLPESERLAIFLANLRTRNRRMLTVPPLEDAGDVNPKFSPDGRTIAFKRVSGFWADDMYTIPVTGGKARRLTWNKRGIWGHAWTADGKSLVVSWQRGTTTFGLWRLPLEPKSRLERIVQGGVDAITPTLNWRTSRLAWAQQMEDVNIYRVPLSGDGQPVRLIASILRDEHPAYSPNGQIAFVSDQSGSREIWLANSDGTGQKRMTSFNGPDLGDLQWSPDGRSLAFYGRAQDHSDIFVLDCDPARPSCGAARRVTSGIRAEVPAWSTGGDFLYFASDKTGSLEIWRQAKLGGQPVRVTYNGGYAARESPDGKWLYFSKYKSESIWRVQAGGNSPAQVPFREDLVIGPPHRVQQKAWAVMADSIVFIELPGNGQSGSLRSFNRGSHRTRTIVPAIEGFRGSRDYGLSVSPDSKWVLYSQLDRSGSNIMFAESN